MIEKDDVLESMEKRRIRSTRSGSATGVVVVAIVAGVGASFVVFSVAIPEIDCRVFEG